MNGKLVQSLINLFPFQYQDMMIKCVFIIGFDKLIKKGYVTNGKPNIHEIIDYANKLQQYGRLQQVQEPCDIRHELDQLKDEISKLTQQIHYNNSIIQRQTQRSHDRLIQNVSPIYDDRKRSASLGFKQQQQLVQKKSKEITPKITETTPQTINQIHITISKHHLDDTEIKSVMRDNLIKDKPPKPIKVIQDNHQKKSHYADYQHTDTEEPPVFEDTDRYPVRDNYIPQYIQYSQHSQQSQQQSQQYQQQQQLLQQSQISSQSNTKQSDQITHNTHNTNQTFAQPQSSQKQLLQTSKSSHGQQRSPNRSPKFKYSQKQQFKKNLETVQEENSQSYVKQQSSHSASSKGRASHRQTKTQQNTQAVSKIKALLDQDKKLHKQHLQDIASERNSFTNSFINSSDKLKMMHQEHLSENNKISTQELNESIHKRAISNNSFYKQQQQQMSPQLDYEPKLMGSAQYNQLQGSISMTNSNRGSSFLGNHQIQDNILIYSKYKQQILDQYSPKLNYHYRPSSVGKQQESELKRSEDFNRSSVSSTFSMFNPNEELKTFFQNDFLERKRFTQQGYSDLMKQSSLNSSQEHNQHHSKYITASQIEDQQNFSKNLYSPQQYQNVDKSNVFNNNRLSCLVIHNQLYHMRHSKEISLTHCIYILNTNINVGLSKINSKLLQIQIQNVILKIFLGGFKKFVKKREAIKLIQIIIYFVVEQKNGENDIFSVYVDGFPQKWDLDIQQSFIQCLQRSGVCANDKFDGCKYQNKEALSWFSVDTKFEGWKLENKKLKGKVMVKFTFQKSYLCRVQIFVKQNGWKSERKNYEIRQNHCSHLTRIKS
ncbi:unnamed protein product [Paramecium pentaurelia]|uniref:Uncharacterized protein n=1 Tax=Paramecium pentaurelia TaxID=43138 RepID=A0A8S1XVV0_9CILI|nr:unnamed protein product [Paramecium pentaurelia]